MTLKDLKQKATASELTLIEATEALLREEVTTALKDAAIGFLVKNLPPSREDLRFDGSDALRSWINNFTKALKP